MDIRHLSSKNNIIADTLSRVEELQKPDANWTESLPLVLLGIRSAFKEDLKISSAELLYGKGVTVSIDRLKPAYILAESPPTKQPTVKEILTPSQIIKTTSEEYVHSPTFASSSYIYTHHTYMGRMSCRQTAKETRAATDRSARDRPARVVGK
ncbi:hypothetical protein EVAR_10590_1 [Eumeta japonica]|uniref:Uncharacterized protein n=1 Tax=Eumeta variegata TaxID=151549 RepID=A0A4C1U2F8_EUMVA|nr:hypothetical protein EVAR_10590_1 [Eumeta japonica]